MDTKKKPFRKGSYASLFLKLAQRNEKGFSRAVSTNDFKGRYEQLQLGNGGSWCREDGSLGRRYNIERIKEKGEIVEIRLHGYKKSSINKHIPEDIKKVIQQQRCVVLDTTTNIEVDHKDGRKDNPNGLQIDDFQPMHKTVNDAKRQHCKECRHTGQRFDAKRLGFAVSHTHGNSTYHGSCVECYLV